MRLLASRWFLALATIFVVTCASGAVFAQGGSTSTTTIEGPPTEPAKRPVELLETTDTSVFFVLPGSVPPTRTKLTFESLDGVARVEVEWRPQESAVIGRTVVLNGKRFWQLALWSDPIRYAEGSSKVNYAWESAYAKLGSKVTKAIASEYCFEFSNKEVHHVHIVKQNEVEIPICIYELKKYETTHSIAMLLDGQDSGTKGTNSLGSNRSFGVAFNDSARELTRLVGEVVLEKAKASLLETVKKQVLVYLNCREENNNFQNTCDLVDNGHLPSLLAQGKTILRSVSFDLIKIVFNQTKKTRSKSSELNDIIRISALLIKKYLTESGIDDRDITLAFFKAVKLIDTECNAGEDICSDLKMSLAVISYCHVNSNCTGKLIHHILENPKEYFSSAPQEIDAKNKDKIIQIILAGIDSLDSDNFSDQQKHLQSAVEFLLRSGFYLKEDLDENSVELIDNYIDFALALIAGDFQQAVYQTAKIINAHSGQKIEPHTLRIIAGLASFLEQDAALTNEDLAKQREARKAAISQMIDLLTERDGRKKSWIIGLHGAVDFGVGVRFNEDLPLTTPLGLHLGFSTDYVSDVNAPYYRGLGFHFDPLNLGRYADFVTPADELDDMDDRSVGDFQWAAVLSPSVAANIYFGSWKAPLYVGARVGLEPGLRDAFGTINVGVHVPLFDFN